MSKPGDTQRVTTDSNLAPTAASTSLPVRSDITPRIEFGAMPKRAPVFLRADVRARLFLLTSREHLFELLLDAREEATTWRALALAGLERLHELSTQLARERSARHRLIAEYRLLRVHTPEAKK